MHLFKKVNTVYRKKKEQQTEKRRTAPDRVNNVIVNVELFNVEQLMLNVKNCAHAGLTYFCKTSAKKFKLKSFYLYIYNLITI